MYRLLNRATVRCYAQAPATRVPPKSLLVKQGDRLERASGHDAQGSKLMVSSFKDIASLFQASSDTPEDEEREMMDHQTYLRQLIADGELKRLLHDKFGLEDPANDMMPTGLLVSQFPKLTAQQMDLVKAYATEEPERPWSKSSPSRKQLQFYLAFGSYGPRRGLPFGSTHRPLDFTFLLPSSPPAAGGKAKIRKLDRGHLVNLYTVTDERGRLFNAKRLDPATRAVLWSAIAVSLVVALQEWRLQRDPEAKVTVLEVQK